jgi:hypothetical protein
MDVVVWLRSLGLGKYEAAFHENEIEETVLPSLTEDHLKQLGVAALGHWVKSHCCSALLGHPRRIVLVALLLIRRAASRLLTLVPRHTAAAVTCRLGTPTGGRLQRLRTRAVLPDSVRCSGSPARSADSTGLSDHRLQR